MKWKRLYIYIKKTDSIAGQSPMFQKLCVLPPGVLGPTLIFQMNNSGVLNPVTVDRIAIILFQVGLISNPCYNEEPDSALGLQKRVIKMTRRTFIN